MNTTARQRLIPAAVDRLRYGLLANGFLVLSIIAGAAVIFTLSASVANPAVAPAGALASDAAMASASQLAATSEAGALAAAGSATVAEPQRKPKAVRRSRQTLAIPYFSFARS